MLSLANSSAGNHVRQIVLASVQRDVLHGPGQRFLRPESHTRGGPSPEPVFSVDHA
jgi:hypothetical protein